VIAIQPDETFLGIDRFFADFMVRLSPHMTEEDKKHLWLASALVSFFTGKGHICADIAYLAGKPFLPEETDSTALISCPDLVTWLTSLQKAPVVGLPGETTPLILSQNHLLYLNRYWQYETMLAKNIIDRIDTPVSGINESLLKDGLNRFFPNRRPDEIDWQYLAALKALKNNFVVISGGPGTGKTYTVSKILALIAEQYIHANVEHNIALTAPTGKAAARLSAVIKDAKTKFNCSEAVKMLIPETASTTHRLLGSTFKKKEFRFNEDNLLPYDAIIVDEASMIDLPLMAKLMSATPRHARFIMLGDKEQLASVEPGAVFGDICNAGENISDSVVVLQKNYRFTSGSGIGALSKFVNEGRGEDALNLIKEGSYDDLRWHDIPSPENMMQLLEQKTLDRYSSHINAASLEEAFLHFDSFRVICALRQGPYGVTTINEIIEHLLKRRGLVKYTGRWYRGQPIMINKNDYRLRLFNGDVGILFPDNEDKGDLRAFFKSEEGQYRKILPARLSNLEPVYSITVHKSQGSEFNDIIVILPDRSSEILTRELIYTAITRAKRGIEIWGNRDVFCEAVSRRTKRQSGLKEALSAIHTTYAHSGTSLSREMP